VYFRNLFENLDGTSQYTPYQAEIAQGRLESLLTFKRWLVTLQLCRLPMLLCFDEGTAAAGSDVYMVSLIIKTRLKIWGNCLKFSPIRTLQQNKRCIVYYRAAPNKVELVTG